MMQKHFNQHTKGKSKGGYGHRCHSSLSYEKEKNSPQYQSYYTDETFSFSEEFAKIVQKFCPKVEVKFSSENLEGILNEIELAFEDILEDMKETLSQEFTQKEDFLQKTTLNLIKYEELLSSREKDFNNQVAAWNSQHESDQNKIQFEKEEIIKLKCRLEKELEIQEEIIQENEKKTSKIIKDYEGKQCELMREKLENQNLKWDLEQMSLKLDEKDALISWREKTMIEDMKKITEEKSKIENERIANNILNFELINAAPRTAIPKRSYSSIEKTDLSADPPSFALNDSRFNSISIQKYEGFSINSKRKNIFSAFAKSQRESEIEDRDSVLRQFEEKEFKDREINEEMMKQEKTRERLKMEKFEFELLDLERREKELIENARREHERKESERKEAEKRENEKLILELKELERLDSKRREEERQEHQRIEDDFKEELMKKIMIKESELEEKQLEIELIEKMVLEEKSSLINERENLHREKQELQSEKLAFYEEIMEERRKIENYLTDIASKTDILNSRREKLLKAQQILEEKEIMIELEKRVGKSPEKTL